MQTTLSISLQQSRGVRPSRPRFVMRSSRTIGCRVTSVLSRDLIGLSLANWGVPGIGIAWSFGACLRGLLAFSLE